MIRRGSVREHPATGLTVRVRSVQRDERTCGCVVLDVVDGSETTVECVLPLGMLERWRRA